MINDKRIEDLKAVIEDQKEQLKRQAQQILDKDRQIRELEAEIGIMARNQMITLGHLTKEGKI